MRASPSPGQAAQAAWACTASLPWESFPFALGVCSPLAVFTVHSQGPFLSQAIWRAPSSVQHPNCSTTLIFPDDVSWLWKWKLQHWWFSVSLVLPWSIPLHGGIEDCSTYVSEDIRCTEKIGILHGKAGQFTMGRIDGKNSFFQWKLQAAEL